MFLKFNEHERVFGDILSFSRRDDLSVIEIISVAIRKYVCHLVSEMCTTSSAQFRYIVARWPASKRTIPRKFKIYLTMSRLLHTGRAFHPLFR